MKDYIDYCKAHQNQCYHCELFGNNYNCCLKFIANEPEKAKAIIAEWKKQEKERALAEKQKIYIIYNEAEDFYGIASTKEKAMAIASKDMTIKEFAVDTYIDNEEGVVLI